MPLEFLLNDDEKDLVPALDSDVPLDKQPPSSVREDIHAAATTADFLEALGDPEASEEITEEDANRARDLFESARTPTQYEKQLPGVMRKLDAILTEYDHLIINDAQQVRTYVTNRLLEESNDDDPKIRMRALELLGKITDVGLFSERQEVTVKHQSTEELEDLLRNKLTKLIDGDVVDADWSEDSSADPTEPSSEQPDPMALIQSVTPDDIYDE